MNIKGQIEVGVSKVYINDIKEYWVDTAKSTHINYFGGKSKFGLDFHSK